MFPKVNPLTTSSWKALIAHQADMQKVQMKDLFKQDSKRFEKMSIQFGEILFDYSKNIITYETLDKLFQLSVESKVKGAIEAMFTGEKINETEGRAVMHFALRSFSDNPITIDGKDIMPKIRETRHKMKTFLKRSIMVNGEDIQVKRLKTS
jgi:glucose-6-phosphate isomerase